MPSNLYNMFEQLENNSESEKDSKSKDSRIIRAPFGWPGGKSRSIKHILPHLPYTGRWVDVFGGSGIVTLVRKTQQFEVYNDRYSGVVAFYRVLRDPVKFQKLCEKIELSVHSREEFKWCKDTWRILEDDVERAYRWFYMISYSFGCLGRNWGRSVDSKSIMAGKIRQRLPEFPLIHERFKRIQIENLDFKDCIEDFSHPDTVFYHDPDYVDGDSGIYEQSMTLDDHRELLALIWEKPGLHFISGTAGVPMYEERDWDERHEWECFRSIESLGGAGGNNKETISNERGAAREVLWIRKTS